VRDNITGAFVPVFVDDDHYTADNVQAAVELALAPIRAIAQLGQAPAPAAPANG
jgi:hypothetical protein